MKNGVIYTSQQAEQRLQRNRYDTILEGVGIDRLTRNFALGQAAVDDAYQVTDAESVTMAY